VGNSIYDSATTFKCFLQIKLEQRYRRTILRHIMSILICIFTIGYRGKQCRWKNAVEITEQQSPIFSIMENRTKIYWSNVSKQR